ncbi:MAG: MATE family efflux transporter [Proteobacteria bacterium]|nr:MATE family efflux transporter [Pseudomonadota bacterium]
MVSQNVLNLVDTAMVGDMGDDALAAVGAASFANFMCVAFVMGLSSGVQAMAARRLGERRAAELAVPLNGGLLAAIALSIPLSAFFLWVAPYAFPFIAPDDNVSAVGVPYLQARLCAMVAVGMNFAFRGYWNGVNRSPIYLRTLVAMHIVNIGLNYGLIYGNLGLPEYGAVGAGIASAIATWFGTGLYIAQALGLARDGGFLRGLPDAATMKTMLRLSLPSGIQQFLFAAGWVALFAIITRMSTQDGAAAAVLVNVMLVALLPGLGLGITGASLAGQALGRKDVADAKRWGWDVVKVAIVVMGVLGLAMTTVPDVFLSPFLETPETLDTARNPLRIFGLFIALDGVGLVLMNALPGAGDARRVAITATALQWGLFLPVAALVGPVLGLGLTAIWIAQIGYRLLQPGILAAFWQRGKWVRIEV